MGIEHFYQIIDRAVVDPFLALTWPEFHKRYGWKGTCQWESAADYLMEFGLDEEADEEKVARILARRTLRWTMLRCSPQFYFLDVVFTHAAAVRRRCPEFWVRRFADHQLMLSAAVGGFLDGRLKKQHLRVVLALHGGPGEAFSLEMPRTAVRAIESAILPWDERPPMFPWQVRGEIHGSCPLGIADTRRFLVFVRRSWSEKWPCPYSGRDTLAELPKNRRKSATIRDNLVAGKLFRWIRQVDNDRLAKLCIFRHFD
jgi:hypothetical protein